MRNEKEIHMEEEKIQTDKRAQISIVIDPSFWFTIEVKIDTTQTYTWPINVHVRYSMKCNLLTVNQVNVTAIVLPYGVVLSAKFKV